MSRESWGEKANFAFHTYFEGLLSTALRHEQILPLTARVPGQGEEAI